jgi:hypothetical protein
MLRSSEREAWVDSAREVRLEDECERRGVRLKKISAVEFAGPCPVCGGDDRFSINTTKQIWNCRGCSKGGDVIELAMHIDGNKFDEAVEKLTNKPPPKPHGNNGAKRAHKSPPGAKEVTVATYDYVDEAGALVLRVLRRHYQKPDGSFVLKGEKLEKTFRQCRPDPDEAGVMVWGLAAGDYMRKGPGQDWYKFDAERFAKLPATRERRKIATAAKSVPYRLPELLEAIASEQLVLVVEGEGKVDALAKLNLRATCNAEGAGKWRAEHAAWLRGADVVIIPDNDDSGRKHAETVARSLAGIATRLRVLELPGLEAKGDVIDWLAEGGTREQLDRVIEAGPKWQPQQESATATAPDDDDQLAKMLAQYSIVLVGGSARIISWKKRRLYVGDAGEHEVPNLIKADSFRLFHRDKFQTIRGQDDKPARQQLTNLFFDQARRYDDLVFAPGAGPAVGNALNLWRGWGVTPKPGKWSRMRNHIRDVVAAGVKEHDEYTVRWIAWAVQNPGRQAEVALVIRGGKGVGKGTFGLAMCRILDPTDCRSLTASTSSVRSICTSANAPCCLPMKPTGRATRKAKAHSSASSPNRR